MKVAFTALALISLPLLSSAPALAQWVPCGIPLTRGAAEQGFPRIASDNAGGAFVLWRETIGGDGDADIFAQHVLGDGSIAPGWPSNGLVVATGPYYQDHGAIVADGLGNAFAAWTDQRDYWTNGQRSDIYLQKLTPSGALEAEWPTNGIPVCKVPGDQWFPQLALDGAGGVYVVWEDYREDIPNEMKEADIYALRFLADGTLAPGWPVDGRPLCTTIGLNFRPVVISDGSGGAFVAWIDRRNDATLTDEYATRILPDGTLAPGWIEDGTPVCTAGGAQGNVRLIGDGIGGALLVWEDARTTPPGYPDPFPYLDIYAQRLTSSGEVVPGWPVNGAAICTAPDLQQDFEVVTDGAGGAIVAWSDYRNYDASAADLYVHRILVDGTIAPGWPVDGIRLSGAPAWQLGPAMVADGSGGAWIVYETSYVGREDLYVQHILGSGYLASGWTPDAPLCQEREPQWRAVAVSDGAGGIIVAWEDGRNALESSYDIYAQHVTDDYVTPVQLALVRTEVAEGTVRLTWQGPEPQSATVQRRTESSGWIALGSPHRVAPERLSYEDRDVVPGRYAYRLAYIAAGVEVFTPEEWVEVTGERLSLAGFSPNPAVGNPRVAFTLPTAESAVLQVFDAAGRMIHSRDLHGLGPGRHLVLIEATISPGVYWLKLRQGAQSLVARGLVVR